MFEKNNKELHLNSITFSAENYIKINIKKRIIETCTFVLRNL